MSPNYDTLIKEYDELREVSTKYYNATDSVGKLLRSNAIDRMGAIAVEINKGWSLADDNGKELECSCDSKGNHTECYCRYYSDDISSDDITEAIVGLQEYFNDLYSV